MKVKYDPYLDGNVPKKDLFEAGQQSRQAEIDELQKRINEALILCEKGCVLKAMSILKGINK